MRTYATQKESLCLFTSARREQRGKSFVKGSRRAEDGKTFDETVARILEEFSGEIITGRNMNLHRIENLL